MRYHLSSIYNILIFLLLLTLCGCSQETEAVHTGDPRDNTPVCLSPSADGLATAGNDLVTVDYSNCSEGYIMLDYLGDSNKVKLQMVGPDYMTYTYDLHNEYEVFPLSSGAGSYTISVYENIQGNEYSTAYSESFDFKVTNEFGAFLYPNQYVVFNENSDIVAKAEDLTVNTYDDLEVITQIYDYVTENITYDYDKAENVQSGYIPDPDEILSIGTGICLDYAAVMTGMLRSQQIPTRLEVGYAGSAYHAWISTYIKDKGWVNGVIEFNGTDWEIMDPTFAANSTEKSLKNFIGDGSNYVVKYIY